MNSDLDMQENQILSLEENVVAQDIRLGVVEDDVDEWGDKITVLEVANVDITDRLITLEEILLGNTSNPRIDNLIFNSSVSQSF